MTGNPYASPETMGITPELKKRRGSRWLELLVVLSIIITVTTGILLWPHRTPRGSLRIHCLHNLKNIAVALHNYHSVYRTLPPAHTVDADGKPLHSWRTLILPYLDRQDLYETIDLSKPWDAQANAEAYKTELKVFRCPAADVPPKHTTYLAIVAANGCFRLNEPRPLSEITDDHWETLMVIEVASEHAVHWMAPQDADEQLVLGFGPSTTLSHPGGINVAHVNGSVGFLSGETSAADRSALISIAGNDHVTGPEW